MAVAARPISLEAGLLVGFRQTPMTADAARLARIIARAVPAAESGVSA